MLQTSVEIVKPGEKTAFYAKIQAEDVRDIVMNHFRPVGFFNRIKTNFPFCDGIAVKISNRDGSADILNAEINARQNDSRKHHTLQDKPDVHLCSFTFSIISAIKSKRLNCGMR